MRYWTAPTVMDTEVLIIGGGLGGCFAAIKAAEEGVKVVVFEKAQIERSGNGGTGLHRIPLVHPDYNFSFREFAKVNMEEAQGIADEDVCLAFGEDTLARINDLESYGVQVRDEKGSFDLRRATDIAPGNIAIWPPALSVWHDLKPKLAHRVASCEQVTVLNRTAGIGLLTEKGEIGGRVAGAIGLETRTGRLVVCRAKAVVITSGGSYRIGRHKNSSYSPTRFIECGSPSNCGEGQAAAFRAGADIVNMEFAKFSGVWKDFSHWGGGPAFVYALPVGNRGQNLRPPKGLANNYSIYKRTFNSGFESEGPLYYDTSEIEGYPEEKGEMARFLCALENEAHHLGYSLWMKERGEDFRKAPVEFEWHSAYLHNNQAGIHMDAEGRSTLEGLFCAGDAMGGGWRQSSGGAFVFGARAGRNAAHYARKANLAVVDDHQIEKEIKPISDALSIDPRDGYSWIELEDKARQIATEYGPPFTNDAKLARGLGHLARIKARYLPKIYARDPREMVRVSEVQASFHNIECLLRAGLFRKETRIPGRASILYKTDYPEIDNTNWLKHTVIRNMNGEIAISTKPVNRLSE